MKKNLLLFLLAASFCCFAALKEDEQKIVYELFETQNMRGNIDRIVSMTISSQLNGIQLTEKDRRQLETKIRKSLSYDRLKKDLADIYLKYFTVEEIREMITFFKTPTGQKMQSFSADVMRDTMLLMQKKIIENTSVSYK